MDEALRIGEIAERVHVSVDAIRYYERRGLLPVARRTAAGYRLFTSDTIERVLFIKQAQELGFSLDEIGTLLTKNGVNDCRGVHDLLQTKLSELDARMKSMREFRGTLSHYLAECEDELKKHGDTAECPVVVEIGHSERG